MVKQEPDEKKPSTAYQNDSDSDESYLLQKAAPLPVATGFGSGIPSASDFSDENLTEDKHNHPVYQQGPNDSVVFATFDPASRGVVINEVHDDGSTTTSEAPENVFCQPATADEPETWHISKTHEELMSLLLEPAFFGHVRGTESRLQVVLKVRPDIANGQIPLVDPRRPEVPEFDFNTMVHCANCGKANHTLAHCTFPIDEDTGDIFGCPICNVKDHGFDQCSRLQTGNNDHTVWTYLIKNRRGKCQIRSNIPIYYLLNENRALGRLDAALLPLPWSREFGIHMAKQHQSKQELPDITDPAVEPGNLIELVKTCSGSYDEWQAQHPFHHLSRRPREMTIAEQAALVKKEEEEGADPSQFDPSVKPEPYDDAMEHDGNKHESHDDVMDIQ